MQKVAAITWVGVILIALAVWFKTQVKYSEVCDELSNKNIVVTVIGEAVSYQSPLWVFERATIVAREGRVWTGVRVVLRNGPFRPVPGLHYRYRGGLKCTALRKNPIAKMDGTRLFFRPQLFTGSGHVEGVLAGDPSIRLWLREGLVVRLEQNVKSFPGLMALTRAVWMGDGGDFPKEVGQIYQWLGLLPVLALSGQHFSIMQRVLHLWLLPLTWMLFYSGRLKGLLIGLWMDRGVALTTILIFWCLAWHLGSVQRTIAMAVTGLWLRCRHIHSRPVERAGSAVLLFLFTDPIALLDAGFMLSATFAVLTLVDFGSSKERRSRGGAYIFFKWFSFSILSVGISAFFFAKISWVAPVAQTFLGVVWECFWIPVAFFLPMVSGTMPDSWAAPVLKGVNFLWENFILGQLELLKDTESAYQTVYCPTFLELLLFEGVLFVAAINVARYFFKLPSGKSVFVPR